MMQSQAPYSNETADQADSVCKSIDFDIRETEDGDVDE